MRKLIYATILTVALLGTLSGCGKESEDSTTTADTTENVGTENNTASTEENASSGDVITSEEATSSEEVKEGRTAQEIADAILSGGEFSEELQPLTAQVALGRLYEIDEELIEDSAFYTNSQATAEEIAVIRVKADASAAEVVDCFNARLEDQKTACTDYLPDEIPKLENAIVTDKGCYVILVVSVDSSKAQSVIDGLLE